tara:strand:- start:2255 stop:2500 length:246 start_codon:yes stop_codon:yes gene_type:complete
MINNKHIKKCEEIVNDSHKKANPVYIATDIETKINTYVDWFFDECGDPKDELRYLMQLILDSEGKAKEDLLDVLSYYTISY